MNEKEIANLIDGTIIIVIVMIVIALPYCCCQVSNEEYLIFHISKDYQIKLKFAHISKFTIE